MIFTTIAAAAIILSASAIPVSTVYGYGHSDVASVWIGKNNLLKLGNQSIASLPGAISINTKRRPKCLTRKQKAERALKAASAAEESVESALQEIVNDNDIETSDEIEESFRETEDYGSSTQYSIDSEAIGATYHDEGALNDIESIAPTHCAGSSCKSDSLQSACTEPSCQIVSEQKNPCIGASSCSVEEVPCSGEPCLTSNVAPSESSVPCTKDSCLIKAPCKGNACPEIPCVELLCNVYIIPNDEDVTVADQKAIEITVIDEDDSEYVILNHPDTIVNEDIHGADSSPATRFAEPIVADDDFEDSVMEQASNATLQAASLEIMADANLTIPVISIEESNVTATEESRTSDAPVPRTWAQAAGTAGATVVRYTAAGVYNVASNWWNSERSNVTVKFKNKIK